MTSRTILLAPANFFHARPASVVAAAARRFDSMVMIGLGIQIADAKDPISLMRLEHPHGRSIDLITDGPDEKIALEAVEAAIARAFSTR